jgi:hypothetical protein
MEELKFNADAQPSEWLNAGNRGRRNASELIGLARGIMADGALRSAEIDLLLDWFRSNPDAGEYFPGNVLLQRLKRYIEDKFIDDDEVADLAELLSQLTGGRSALELKNAQAATLLPLTEPYPNVAFQGREFVFTGRFFYGPRKVCEETVTKLGGSCHNNPRGSTHYLVIGTLGSKDWVTSVYGTKIEKAMEMVRKGKSQLAIISEDYWASHV